MLNRKENSFKYSGRYFWHVGSDPSFTITVGPTQSVKLPKQFRQDTEKYGGQAKLERVDSGGFTMTGTVIPSGRTNA